MGKVLSEAPVARYHRDGFLFPVAAFGRFAVLAALLAAACAPIAPQAPTANAQMETGHVDSGGGGGGSM